MSDTRHLLSATEPLREPVLRAAIRSLRLPRGSHGLDAGCGIGFPSLLLAEAVPPGGHVTGLDLSARLLAYARGKKMEASLLARTCFAQGDLHQLPFADDCFDWAWSADLVGYAPLEPLPLLMELARVVKPGGVLAILAWSSEKLLPGYPLLEARLGATAAGIAPFARGQRPETHFLRLAGRLRAAGLQEIRVRTLAGDVQAPLTDGLRTALVALFEMRWPGVQAELPAEDGAEYRRLCLPELEEFIVDHPDYYGFFTYTLFQGRLPR